ncbi:hypothetical protein Q4493_06680 [Colwellia sp. 1_MG-2023]|uniref:hypothetical protein n=1 Tax=Colwellia sp. 1_MG-2023 TaxID=3062649 RepID=UPI0026E19CC1|nr:hypothetical protein [Colwellia sp. 1_MG-2023]MDO6445462.1 hypothetical protein [Colwellia sp. 1_MG-2023]
MELIQDAFVALFFAGLPVYAFSFLMVYFSYQKGYLSTSIAFKNAFDKNDENPSQLSKKNKKNLPFFHSKWVTFGGGFYGLIAVLTFLIIELLQIVNFWLGVTRWQDVTDLFSIGAFIGMIVDSFMNMITAAIWFTYWPNKLPASHFLLWILIGYGCYRLGAHSAKYFYIHKRFFPLKNTDTHKM